MNFTPRIRADEGQHRLFVRHRETMVKLLEIFRDNAGIRLLAVVDDHFVPIGIVDEDDIRDLLYNPYGHALMTNPGIGSDIAAFVKPCAMAEYDLSNADLVAAHSRQNNSSGLILTAQGKYLETVSNERLISLLVDERVNRAEKISQFGQNFTDQIVALSDQLSSAATHVYALAESLDNEAGEMASAATNVATGAAQSSAGLADVHLRGQNLAASMMALAAVASEAKQVRSETRDIIDQATPQMQALADSGAAIHNITGVIQNIVRQTSVLALNAQIEAVRQNSAAHGFVAVANEIKLLAGQTRGSADEVSHRADQIGAVVGNVVDGHLQIVEAIEKMSIISNQIDGSVETQTATGIAIAGFVEQAAAATSDIAWGANNIHGRAAHVQKNAKELERVSALLLSSASAIGDRSRAFVDAIQAA